MATTNPIQQIHYTAPELSKKKWEQLKGLKKSDIKFDAYKNLLRVFQTFNKDYLLKWFWRHSQRHALKTLGRFQMSALMTL